MQTPQAAALEVATAQAWRPLERLLRLAQGFLCIVLVVDSPQLVQPLKRRLEDWLRAQQRAFIDVVQVEPTGFAEKSLRSLFAQVRAKPAAASAPPVAWLEAQRGHDEPWAAARREFFSRLNERRSRLELELAGPLILLLPANGEREFSHHAPDLWHIRHLSLHLHLSAPAQAPPLEARLAATERPDTLVATVSSLTPQEQRWQAQWQALFGDRPLERLNRRDQRFRQLSLSDGLEAVEAARRAGRLDAALALANLLLQLVAVRAEQGLPTQAERAWALVALGSVAEAQGEWAQAEAAYAQGLQLSRQLLERLGPTPEALRDLAVSLSKLGSTAKAAGKAEQAEACFREALDLCHQRVARDPNPKQARDELLHALQQLIELPSPDAASLRAQADALRASAAQETETPNEKTSP